MSNGTIMRDNKQHIIIHTVIYMYIYIYWDFVVLTCFNTKHQNWYNSHGIMGRFNENVSGEYPWI